eukprot:86328-Pelagomonas_calceolata.AAC.1
MKHTSLRQGTHSTWAHTEAPYAGHCNGQREGPTATGSVCGKPEFYLQALEDGSKEATSKSEKIGNFLQRC